MIKVSIKIFDVGCRSKPLEKTYESFDKSVTENGTG